VETPVRFRLSGGAMVAVVLLLLCVAPAAFASPWGLPLLLLPLAAAVWVRRVGVDVDADGVTARGAVGRRRVPWGELAGIRVGERGDLWLVTTGGTEVRLPVVRARDLPRLAEASAGRIELPAPPAQ
jgi:hypothetical protein